MRAKKYKNVFLITLPPIVQVLEAACSSQDLNFEEYDLYHQNKALDLSLTTRFANISNNAQLELKRLSGPRLDGEVTVAVSTESGDRKTGRFMSSTSLYEVVDRTTGMPRSKKGHQVVCIYMRKEVAGEESLRNTAIRNLGLTSGNAVLRVITREVDAQGQALQQAHVENLRLNKPGDESQVDQAVTQVKESVSKFGKSLKSMATGLFDRKNSEDASSSKPTTSFSGQGRTLQPTCEGRTLQPAGQGRTLQPAVGRPADSSDLVRSPVQDNTDPNSAINWVRSSYRSSSSFS